MKRQRRRGRFVRRLDVTAAAAAARRNAIDSTERQSVS